MVLKEVEEEPMKEKPKKEEEEKFRVVKELPVRPVRRFRDEETGIITNFITIEEALTSLIGGGGL